MHGTNMKIINRSNLVCTVSRLRGVGSSSECAENRKEGKTGVSFCVPSKGEADSTDHEGI
jgi:hypothetical protein